MASASRIAVPADDQMTPPQQTSMMLQAKEQHSKGAARMTLNVSPV
jgi:hypothetical protein